MAGHSRSAKTMLPYSNDPVKDKNSQVQCPSLNYINSIPRKSNFSGTTIFSTTEYQTNIYRTRALLVSKPSIDSMDANKSREILKDIPVDDSKLSYQFDLGLRTTVSIPSQQSNNLATRTVTWNQILKTNRDTSDYHSTDFFLQEGIYGFENSFGKSLRNRSLNTNEEDGNIGGEDDAPDFGPKIGVNLSQISPNQIPLNNSSGSEMALLDVKNIKIGVDVGVFGRVHVRKGSDFFIQSELYFSTKSTAYRLENLTTLSVFTLTERYYDLNLPIHFGAKYKVKNRIYFRPQAGFIFGKRFGNEKNLKRVVPSYEQMFNKLDVGWQLGIGMDIHKLRIDLRYGGDFSKYANHMRFYGNDTAFGEREKQLEIAIGWSILRTRKKD